MIILKGPKLTPSQWKFLATALSNMAQAIILFSLAALFVPEVVNLSKEFSRYIALVSLFIGLLILIFSVIITNKGGS